MNMHLFDLGVSLSDISHLKNSSQPQIFRKEKLGPFPVHISCGVLSMDFDGTLLSVKNVVSRAYPENDKGKSDLLIIDWTMSNKVLFLHPDMPFLYGVPEGIS
jgi:hypothetical protein